MSNILVDVFGIVDYIEATFWSITYILIIITALKNKSEYRFPIASITIFINLAWEVASVIFSYSVGLKLSRANIIRFTWFFLDIFILMLFIYKFKKNPDNHKHLYPYLIFFVFITTLFLLGFVYTESVMVISAFFIDAHMEFMFYKDRKQLDPANRLLIGFFKILGDTFALIYYFNSHFTVPIFGAIALIFNILYVLYGFKEHIKKIESQKTYQKQRKYKKKQKVKKTHRNNNRKKVK